MDMSFEEKRRISAKNRIDKLRARGAKRRAMIFATLVFMCIYAIGYTLQSSLLVNVTFSNVTAILVLFIGLAISGLGLAASINKL